MMTITSLKSTNQKQTLKLIEYIYRQMEKINNQFTKKDQIDQERYQEMEKKMRKLQKKY